MYGAGRGGSGCNSLNEGHNITIHNQTDRLPPKTANDFCVATLTEVRDIIAGGVERASVELEPDDGKYDDGEEQEQRDVHQRTDRLEDRGNHNLKA